MVSRLPTLDAAEVSAYHHSRGDTKCRGMIHRVKDISFHVPESSSDLVPLISEKHILWIDVRRMPNCLCLRQASTSLPV